MKAWKRNKMYNEYKVSALILAAGMGRRMGVGVNKVLMKISGKSVLAYTVKCFDNNKYVDEILVAAAENETYEIEKTIAEARIKKPCRVIVGGKSRQESSYAAVREAQDGIVLIHDGARAFTENKIIDSVIENAAVYGAAAPGIGVTDTVKKIENGMITETLNRDELCLIQTPQGFKRNIILTAHEKAKRDGFFATDDAMLSEHAKIPVKLTEGSRENIKLTFKKDIFLAKEIIKNYTDYERKDDGR